MKTNNQKIAKHTLIGRSVILSDFEFGQKSNAIERQIASQIKTSILIKIDKKTCFIKDHHMSIAVTYN